MNALAHPPRAFVPAPPAGWTLGTDYRDDRDGKMPCLVAFDPFGCEHNVRWHNDTIALTGRPGASKTAISAEQFAMLIAVGFEGGPRHGDWTPHSLQIAFEALPLYRQMAVIPPEPVAPPQPKAAESERLRGVYRHIAETLRAMTLGGDIVYRHQTTYYSPQIGAAQIHYERAMDSLALAGRMALGEIEP